jgi:hypothetical protein
VNLLRQVVQLLGNGNELTASSSATPQQAIHAESLPSSQATTANQTPATTNQPSVAVDEHRRLFNRQSVKFIKIFICILHQVFYVYLYSYLLENSTIWKQKNIRTERKLEKR